MAALVKDQPSVNIDAVVVGAGFAGLYAVHRLCGLGRSVQCLEAGSGVGGTWFWNRYPGARCNVDSMHYSYCFSHELEQEWEWTERYPSQPEILSYLNHVADRFDLRQHIRFDARVVAAVFDENAGLRSIVTEDGATFRARYCVMAVGCLSLRKDPAAEFDGVDAFRGQCYATSERPAGGVDFGGQRVGVISTGPQGFR